jgi:transcriptional regulator GlxA family with amidase domain
MDTGGTRHRSLVTDNVGASLYFAPEAISDTSSHVRILVANPLMREMVLHATRWERGASETDPSRRQFPARLALLRRVAGTATESVSAHHRPPVLRRAMDYALADLAGATQAGAITHAALSERSFRRLFMRETGLTWQAWLGQARIQMAMGLLIQGRRVTDVAADVGYASLSAFAKAFAQTAGEGPAQFRKRHLAAQSR